jgi:hypothetical protein
MERIFLNEPTLMFGCGAASVGKSTFFRELIKYVDDAFIVEKDVIVEAFLATRSRNDDKGLEAYRLMGEPNSFYSDYYGMNVKFQTGRALLNIAKANLVLGKHPMLDYNWVREIKNGYFDQIVEPYFSEISHRRKMIFCHVDPDVLRPRMIARASPRDVPKLLNDESWNQFVTEQLAIPIELEKYDHIKVDTGRQPIENVQPVLDYLLR